jgi:hypothetical protein
MEITKEILGNICCAIDNRKELFPVIPYKYNSEKIYDSPCGYRRSPHNYNDWLIKKSHLVKIYSNSEDKSNICANPVLLVILLRRNFMMDVVEIDIIDVYKEKKDVVEFRGTYKYWKYSDYYWNGGYEEFNQDVSNALDKASQMEELIISCLAHAMDNNISCYTNWIDVSITENCARMHSLMGMIIDASMFDEVKKKIMSCTIVIG